jgi:hypothetical protein
MSNSMLQDASKSIESILSTKPSCVHAIACVDEYWSGRETMFCIACQ